MLGHNACPVPTCSLLLSKTARYYISRLATALRNMLQLLARLGNIWYENLAAK